MRQTEFRKNTIETVSSYLPLITGYFVILGSIRLMVYYSFFNLPIFDYLTLSEILMSFFDRSLIIGLGIVFCYGLIEFFFNETTYKETLEYKKKFIQSNIFYKLKDFFISDWLLVVLNILLFILLFLNIFIQKHANATFVICFVILSIFNLLFKFVERIMTYTAEINFKSPKPAILFYLGSYYLTTTILLAISDAQSLKIYNKGTKTNLVFQTGETFTPDSSKFYVGKTNEYVFIYHNKEERTEVIKISNIKTINYFEINSK